MARRYNEPAAGADRAKVRVFFAEVEGNNDSVQEALKTMVSAMGRPVRVISDQKSNGGATLLTQTTDPAELPGASDQIEEVEEIGEGAEASTIRKPRGTGKKVDRNAGLDLVPDLDFRLDGEQTLKDFVEGKKPRNDIEFVVTFVYYMQHTMKLTKIGPAHVRTAFKEVDEAVPVDLKQTIRNIKKSKMWLNFADIEDIRTTTQGDNLIEHEMGRSE